MTQRITVGLIGNPNAGKTTLFNALTGAKQIVGNWPGVTVERKSGNFSHKGAQINVIDLPGIYSLTTHTDSTAIDEKIACEFILSQQADIIINVLDASNLERNLYLTTQLIAMQIPIIIVLNMMDIAKQHQIEIDHTLIERQLGCPVLPLTSTKHIGIKLLKDAIINLAASPYKPSMAIPLPDIIETSIFQLQQNLVGIHLYNARYLALGLLEDDRYVQTLVPLSSLLQAKQLITAIKTHAEDPDILIADARYGFIHALIQAAVYKVSNSNRTFTTLLDQFVLNRILGIPIFLIIMYLMFAFAINIGGAFQDFFDISTDIIFVQGLGNLLIGLHSPAWLTAILANGIGIGINTTATFIPVIGAMFLFLSFLEGSGYMARAAFVMDRLMRAIGLPGKSFVPLIIGFGCNVPAIMAARTLESQRDRILTIMMSPFMSCGARLTIFAVFAAAFFAQGSAHIIFALYLIGIMTALVTGLILRKTILQGSPQAFVMELPLYHLPTFRPLYTQTWTRLKSFILNAGKIIIPICALMGVLNSITPTGQFVSDAAAQYSLLARFSQWLTPVFAPLGLTPDNWPATVALLTGTLAKEVVVATLNTLYSQIGHLTPITQNTNGLLNGLAHAIMTIPHNLAAIPQAFSNPLLATIKDQTLSTGAFGIMQQHFDGKIGAFAYLLFILLYIPCVSTTAVIARELNKQWAIFSIAWSIGLAYGIATLFYQMATLSQHPYQSLSWLIGIIICFAITVLGLRYYAQKHLFRSTLKEGMI